MEKITQEIRENWMILGFIVAMILWYGSVNSRITAVEAKQIDQQTLVEKINQIQADVSFIRGQLSKLNNK